MFKLYKHIVYFQPLTAGLSFLFCCPRSQNTTQLVHSLMNTAPGREWSSGVSQNFYTKIWCTLLNHIHTLVSLHHPCKLGFLFPYSSFLCTQLELSSFSGPIKRLFQEHHWLEDGCHPMLTANLLRFLSFSAGSASD